MKKPIEEKETVSEEIETIFSIGYFIVFWGIIWMGSTVGMFPDTYQNVTSTLNQTGKMIGDIFTSVEYKLFNLGLSKPTLFFYMFYVLIAYWIYIIGLFIIRHSKPSIRYLKNKMKIIVAERRWEHDKRK